MLPLDPYYMQILFLNGEIKESIGWPWELRVIPNFANFLVYKFFPCLEVNKIQNYSLPINTVQFGQYL